MKRQHLNLRTKTGIVVLLMFIFDILLIIGLRAPFALTLSNLLFFEGAIFLGVGAYVASGTSSLRMERPATLYARPEGHAEYIRQHRKKQFFFGVVLILIGAALIGLSIAIGFFLT